MIIFFLILLSLTAQAQQFCGTPPPIGELPQIRAAGAVDTVVYRVPIVFTVLGDAQDQTDVTDAFLASQFAQLNQDFRGRNSDISTLVAPFVPVDARIEFYIYQPTRRVLNNGADYDAAHQFDMYKPETGGASIVPNVLNVYYCNISFAGGFSVFPRPGTVGQFYDANVIRIRSALGTGRRIATHEIGHWFDLPHTFQGLCADGDGCTDTPPISSSTSGCPLTRKACDNVTPAFVQNYMDYSSCLVAFSPCQKERMRNVLNPAGIRSYLITSQPNTPPTVKITKPTKDTTIVQGGSLLLEIKSSDSDGISRVEAYSGNTKLYTFTQPPYWISFSGLSVQVMKFSAKAYDNLGQSTNSDTVKVTVTTQTKIPIVEQWIEGDKLKVRTATKTYSFKPE